VSASFPIRDPQSGAYTRAFFDEIVDREVERSRRHGSVLSVLSIVLANWAEFSASVPPQALDGAIHTVANTLMANLRMTDYLFRWEEDEFLAGGRLGDSGVSAVRLDVPPSEAYGVACFYGLFSVTPRPARVLHVCDDIAWFAVEVD